MAIDRELRSLIAALAEGQVKHDAAITRLAGEVRHLTKTVEVLAREHRQLAHEQRQLGKRMDNYARAVIRSLHGDSP
jgi:hypothetical protein